MPHVDRAPTTTGHRLRPTLVQVGAARYRRAGGAWERGSLDASFRSADADATGARSAAAVVDGSGRLDAAGIEAAIGTLAGRLAATGVRRGDVVGWQLPNGAAPFLLYRACWRLGAVAAPLHHRLGGAEVQAALDQVHPALLIAAR